MCDVGVAPHPDSSTSSALLPSITAPTISHLYPSKALNGVEWLAVETVIAEQTVRELFPKLLEAGAVGIVEFPLNKIIG